MLDYYLLPSLPPSLPPPSPSPPLPASSPSSAEGQKLHHNSVKLLSSLSGFQATRKAWRRETFDLFMANNFFVMKMESLQE